MKRIAVVLAGGVGTRLYPASSPERPKQFLALDGERSLLTRTVERVEGLVDATYVLTRPEYADLVPAHAPDAAVLVEPAGRDTGPALAYAAHEVREREGECVLLNLPSDHHVEGDFAGVAERALGVAAETGKLVTLGVEPTRAATGYGYIKPGTDHGDYFDVAGFFEKPDAGAAERYRYNGFLWNAGIFAWTPDAFLAAARDSELEPLVDGLDAGQPERGFRLVDSVSVDYAVLEDATNAAVVPADFAWDDLGAWDALTRIGERDGNGNVVVGNALALDAENCVVATDEDTHVSVVGCEGITVAAYDDRVLVVPTRDAQRVREVVDRLEE
ncbi:mannose-1-phosphate guanylyltransferase [Halomarina ordinaria]|uniref:Mannose-1-phosphate guanylyltransferase n=1 Tax=Halomarina ordinaria TaxID=3033939 RepID=A0ABD5UAA2_9EURY|nr:sugar phosphate nucleotidyltransferase [Halomarina sp. PSRA2]